MTVHRPPKSHSTPHGHPQHANSVADPIGGPAQIVSEQNQRLMGLAQAAGLLGVHRSTLVRAWKSGHLPIVRIGRRVLVRAAAIEQFVRSCEQRPGSDSRILNARTTEVALPLPPSPVALGDSAETARSVDRATAHGRAQRILGLPGGS